ncbi:hypothetical protein [Frigidibacter sp. ROC022]|nr:hypothetical protein [Frigidibacter sp. ROC022]MCR8724315.1 hypothetical protein [Frigidibacter sp. ROC022]
MRLFHLFRSPTPTEVDYLDQPEFRGMSKRDLADLPMPRPFPASIPARD